MTESANQPFLTERARLGWRIAQVAVWLVGAAIFILLIAIPPLGLDAFWNVLIPVAPALLVFAPGVWRNICPLASTALFARHNDHIPGTDSTNSRPESTNPRGGGFQPPFFTARLGGTARRAVSSSARLGEPGHRAASGPMKARRIMTQTTQGIFTITGVVLLIVIVPLRHAVFDTSGFATAMLLAGAAIVAITLSRVFEWKSAWCSGLCPVHPVEKLYGQRPALSPANAHCHACHRCVRVCPDSTASMTPLLAPATRMHQWAGTIIVGGFAGFVWGWFQIPDFQGGFGWANLSAAYALPMAGLALSLAVFIAARRLLAQKYHPALTRVFAAGAVAIYYWYRIPGLAGFGPIPGDGMLIDLTETLPAWTVAASRVATTGLFAWWLVLRSNGKRAWTVRPPFADTAGADAGPRVVPLTVAATAGMGDNA